ncbi:MAG: glycosyltransferase [Clostridiales bacterium]|nr:glycosyltransferase [Clostridiales bacterium]
MKLDPTKVVMLIPSLEPDERLPVYARALLDRGFARMVIVDDGSSEAYQEIFSRLDAMEGVTVVHHEVNKGKGVALKTGYAHIAQAMPEAVGVITADADGQHTVEDCWRLAEALCEGKDEMYLGSRDFDLDHVPPKSRFGNKTTSAAFKLFYGQWLPDTQTGLRAFPAGWLQFMQDVKGERFEYEMNVLIACARDRKAMVPITIETVYENQNAGTHFKPVRDSLRIYKVILGNFITFSAASLASGLLDFILLTLLGTFVFHNLTHGAGLAKIIARCISAPVNFLLNSKYVFGKNIRPRTFIRYIILAVLIMLVSSVLVDQIMIHLNLPKFIIGIVGLLVDLVLYFVSYRVQSQWVFQEEKKNAE